MAQCEMPHSDNLGLSVPSMLVDVQLTPHWAVMPHPHWIRYGVFHAKLSHCPAAVEGAHNKDCWQAEESKQPPVQAGWYIMGC